MTKYFLSLILLFSIPSLAAENTGSECNINIEDTFQFLKTEFPDVVKDMETSSALSELTWLSIGYKGFSDDDIFFLCALGSQLEQLDIYNDNQNGVEFEKLTGAGLKWLSYLTHLKHIDFDGNNLKSADLVQLNQVPRLLSIRIGMGNDLSGDLSSLEQHPSLQSMTFQKSNLSDTSLAWMATSKKTWSSVTILNNPNLTAQALYASLGPAKIQSLTTDVPVETAEPLKTFSTNPVLTSLSVPLDKLPESELPQALAYIGSIPNLKQYDVSSFPYSEALLSGLNGNANIKSVVLAASMDDTKLEVLTAKATTIKAKAPGVENIYFNVTDFNIPAALVSGTLCSDFDKLNTGIQVQFLNNGFALGCK